MALQNLGDFSTPTPVAIGTRGTPNWGSTFLGDLIANERFKSAVYEQIFSQFAFTNSGIITRDSNLDCREGGISTTLPLVLPFEPFEEVIQSNDTWGESGAGHLTPQKVNSRTQIYPIMHRGFLVAADKLSQLGSGIDPLGAAAQYLGEGLAAHKSNTLITMLAGMFASGGPLVSNVLNISRTGAGPSTAANFLTSSSVTRAKAKLGERSKRLRMIAFHSDVYHYLQDIGMLTWASSTSVTATPAWGAGGIGVTDTDVSYFAGLRTVVDDRLVPTIDATNGDKYPVYLFEPGAIKQGVQEDLNIDYGYNLESKQWMMSPDIHYSFGIPGLTYGGPLGSPTNAQLGTAGNWTMAYTQGARLIPIVRMVVNTPLAVNP